MPGEPSGIPPEGNYDFISLGDLAASLTAAAAGHQGLADMLLAELTELQATAGMSATTGWQGAGGTAMLTAAQEYAMVLELAMLWCLEAFTAATEVAMAHQTAMSGMIPTPVCTTNLATTQGLCDTNWFGQNSPAIAGLVAQYQGFWVQNASLMNFYQSVTIQALAVLSTPPPMDPTMADPAAPAAAAAQATAQTALQTGRKTVTEGGAAASPLGSAAESPMGSMSSLFGEMSSLGGQFSSAGSELPQLLTSAPGQLSGLFSPLSSMFSSGGLQDVGALGPAAGTPLSAGGSAISGLGGGGSALGGVFTSAPASASMVRPASSFSAPSTPRLPGGWPAGSAAPAEPIAAPSAGSGGGLYGAPAAAGAHGREQQSTSEKNPGRTLQVTGRPAHDAGDARHT